jgi:type I restriction enzyme S subunit
VKRLDVALASTARLVEAARRFIGRVNDLERAALAKAFRGELVDQDPADEPAAALLDRGRATAEYAAKTNRAKPTRAATKSTSPDRRRIGT